MCFSMQWLLQILIFAVIIGAVIAILKIVVPYALSMIGAEISGGIGVIMSVFRIVLWAVVVIFVLVICFQLISCLLSYGGGVHLPSVR
jgi:hypothetical protein